MFAFSLRNSSGLPRRGSILGVYTTLPPRVHNPLIPIYFNIGKTTLDEKEMQHFDFIAQNLIAKADQETDILITVMGSSDGNTGSMRRNQHLSEARGKYIFDLLTTQYGVAPERLTIKSEVVKKAAKPELSRAVIISF